MSQINQTPLSADHPASYRPEPVVTMTPNHRALMRGTIHGLMIALPIWAAIVYLVFIRH